jgi:hypothetical protein
MPRKNEKTFGWTGLITSSQNKSTHLLLRSQKNSLFKWALGPKRKIIAATRGCLGFGGWMEKWRYFDEKTENWAGARPVPILQQSNFEKGAFSLDAGAWTNPEQ